MEIAHSRPHTKSFSPERVAINRSKTGLGGSTAHGRVWRVDGAWARSLWSCCAVPRSPRDFSRCAHGNWCRRPLRSHVRGPSSLRHQFRTDFLKTSLCTKLDILAPAHRSSNEREAPQRMQVASAVAHGPKRPAPPEKRSSGRLFSAASLEPEKALLAPASEARVHRSASL